ncbi:V-type ATP synthase subunit F [Fusibacter sp. JL216-2]|uniref:V-type ATP synthase subunit F n=1 Tax=Fusibacter sp. JL216-2 TaxID=3071453 RepID=UPI003D354DA1
MKSFLISDNKETLIGMRLTGISGMILEKEEDIIRKIDALIKDDEVGIIMITGGIMKIAEQAIMQRKLEASETLIVQIPGTHEDGEGDDDRLTRYIRESIGLKL